MLEDLMNTTVTIERKSSTKDTSGSPVATWQAVADLDNIPALIQPKHGHAMKLFGQRQVFLTHYIYLAQKYDIRRGDRVSHRETGHYFTVHGFEDMAGQTSAWRIECVQET